MAIRTPVLDFLLEHMRKKPISFHMPGHKGSTLYRECGYGEFLDNFMDCDITEIQGADNLFQTEGILRDSQERYAALYEVKKSYLQINGSSGANIASMLASVPKGRKIIMARNCHKSCFNALSLGDIQPIYVYPEMIEEYGISGAIPPEEIENLLIENDDADAVILPSPNYYGVCSDIKRIAEIVHKYNKILIVDQAHGAHLKLFNKFGIKNMPLSAEEAGADLIVNSIHKTLASLTESALLNVNSDRVDLQLLEDKLQAIESTSPSYVLMSSLDINASIIFESGERLFKQWAEALDYFYTSANNIEGLRFIEDIPGLDRTKINFSLGDKGIMGDELEQILMKEYGIYIELFTGELVMCMTGIGNTYLDIKKLIDALDEIAKNRRYLNTENSIKKRNVFKQNTKPELYDVPVVKKKVKLKDSEGLICASSIIPYPPGIPFICPGEKITAESIEYIKEMRNLGEKVIGVTEDGEIFVGR
ncbi:MAG: aminotransferase class I/II-fold pyridoxal phosphate-dependent enzyme [Lentihominibacter sp.]